MTSGEHETQEDGRLTPADVHDVRFPSGTMMRPGYGAAEVDRFLARIAQELARLHAEKAELRDQVRALSADMDAVVIPEAPSDQAVRLLATAQQTADQYVAEAEDFSRQMSEDARARHEEELRTAREAAGAIIQTAHEAAARMVAHGDVPGEEAAAGAAKGATKEELEEQVAYLRAFAQACRVQLRSYLEALLTDVENEWGRADPAALPQAPIRTPAQRGPKSGNVAREMPLSDSTSEHPIVTADGAVEMLDQRR